MLLWYLSFILIGGWLIFTFNKLVTLNNRAREAWADIDVLLKRRYDLIPNLVSTVKVYATHEKAVFENVTQARTKALTAHSISEKDSADDSFRQALQGLLAIAENYPQLRASENFLKFQEELSSTENTLARARRFYNGAVRDFNTMLEQFPNRFFATLLGFQVRAFFQAEEDERGAVKSK